MDSDDRDPAQPRDEAETVAWDQAGAGPTPVPGAGDAEPEATAAGDGDAAPPEDVAGSTQNGDADATAAWDGDGPPPASDAAPDDGTAATVPWQQAEPPPVAAEATVAVDAAAWGAGDPAHTGTLAGQTLSDGDGLPGAVSRADEPTRVANGADIATAPTVIAGGGNDEAKPRTSTGFQDGWHFTGREGPLTGRTIGDFELGGIIGEGGMGTVYRARQNSLRRRAAIKVLPPALTDDPHMRARFSQEAQTASSLQSPHVVNVYAAGEENGIAYFAMEYVEGTDLGDIIRQRRAAEQPFAPDEAARFVAQAARGLEEACRLGIVHRDIKPANLMVTANGTVKIADFGIAKITGEQGLTLTGTAMGTPSYCSPEQGRGAQVDGRADIYSLGVILYEMLCGRRPFDGATPNALIYQHNYVEPEMPTVVCPDLPVAYQGIVLRCLQKDPEQRYGSAGELVADLERVVAGSAPMSALMSAFGTGADEAMRRLGIKRHRPWPYILAAALLAAVGLGVWLWQRDASRQDAAEVRLRSDLAALDLPAPFDEEAAAARLARLRRVAGAADADLQRWQGKLERVAQLRERLRPLDAAQLPDAALQQRAAADLIALEEELGPEAAEVLRWRARLGEASAAATAQREALAPLDAPEQLTLAAIERHTGGLERLARLAGAQDDDVRRWRERIDATRERRAELRASLGGLDSDEEAPLTRARLATHERALAQLRVIEGEADADMLRWQQRLGSEAAAIAALTTNLRRIDRVTTLTQGLMVELADDLDRYAERVGPDDPDLRTWRERFAHTRHRIAELRERLAVLDTGTVPTPSGLDALRGSLGEFVKLVGREDGEYQAWAARLDGHAQRHAALAQAMTRFADETALREDEIDALRAQVQAWTQLGGLDADRSTRYLRRLERERAAIAALRARLGAERRIDAQLPDQVDALAQRAGADDALVRAWRERLREWRTLGAALAVLDRPAPLNEAVDDQLARYGALVREDDAALARWTAKVEQVRALRAALAPIDQVVPLPDGSETMLAQLAQLVGEHDPQLGRWRAEVARVGVLRERLGQIADDVLTVDAQTVDELNELLALIGDADPEVAQLIERLRLLGGPPRPAWASDYGRDDYGLYADLTCEDVVQRFRYVPPGSFRMGSPTDEADRDADEEVVAVTLSQGYWLAATECTQALWRAVTGAQPSRFPGEAHPVERVDHAAVRAFLRELGSRVGGAAPRLPTEAEWEYACRAGRDGAWSVVAGAEAVLPDAGAWYAENCDGTREVALRNPNRLGLYDMHGNVWEWCDDAYAPYPAQPTSDPHQRGGTARVARGGSWCDRPALLRAGNRIGLDPATRSMCLGLRIALDVDWQREEPAAAQEALAAGK